MPFKYAAILIFTITTLFAAVGYYLDWKGKQPKKRNKR
jgi:hypothetical protein